MPEARRKQFIVTLLFAERRHLPCSAQPGASDRNAPFLLAHPRDKRFNSSKLTRWRSSSVLFYRAAFLYNRISHMRMCTYCIAFAKCPHQRPIRPTYDYTALFFKTWPVNVFNSITPRNIPLEVKRCYTTNKID